MFLQWSDTLPIGFPLLLRWCSYNGPIRFLLVFLCCLDDVSTMVRYASYWFSSVAYMLLMQSFDTLSVVLIWCSSIWKSCILWWSDTLAYCSPLLLGWLLAWVRLHIFMVCNSWTWCVRSWLLGNLIAYAYVVVLLIDQRLFRYCF